MPSSPGPSNSATRRLRRRCWLSAGTLVFVFALAGCGGGSSSTDGDGNEPWSDLVAVVVSAENPSIPLQEGESPPEPARFTTPAELRKVTAALNANHIHRVEAREAPPGCAGGTEIEIEITTADRQRIGLSGYTCADTLSGDIGGDLPGFLAAIGVDE